MKRRVSPIVSSAADAESPGNPEVRSAYYGNLTKITMKMGELPRGALYKMKFDFIKLLSRERNDRYSMIHDSKLPVQDVSWTAGKRAIEFNALYR